MITVGNMNRDAKRRAIYLALSTDHEGGSCFSIYQISWINIKNELFVNKRRHLEFVYVSIWQCFGDHFLWFYSKFSQKIFFYRPVNIPTSQSLSLSWYLLVQLLPFTANISSFETVAKQGAILNPVPKQWISKDIPSYGSQSEGAKISIHWFGEC